MPESRMNTAARYHLHFFAVAVPSAAIIRDGQAGRSSGCASPSVANRQPLSGSFPTRRSLAAYYLHFAVAAVDDPWCGRRHGPDGFTACTELPGGEDFVGAIGVPGLFEPDPGADSEGA